MRRCETVWPVVAGHWPDGYMDKWLLAQHVLAHPLTHISTGPTTTVARSIRPAISPVRQGANPTNSQALVVHTPALLHPQERPEMGADAHNSLYIVSLRLSADGQFLPTVK
jgi:hypothetical protein